MNTNLLVAGIGHETQNARMLLGSLNLEGNIPTAKVDDLSLHYKHISFLALKPIIYEQSGTEAKPAIQVPNNADT